MHSTTYKIDTDRDLLYSIGNSTQYSVITYMRKEPNKNECMYSNHFAVHRKLTQHCKPTV